MKAEETKEELHGHLFLSTLPQREKACSSSDSVRFLARSPTNRIHSSCPLVSASDCPVLRGEFCPSAVVVALAPTCSPFSVSWSVTMDNPMFYIGHENSIKRAHQCPLKRETITWLGHLPLPESALEILPTSAVSVLWAAAGGSGVSDMVSPKLT